MSTRCNIHFVQSTYQAKHSEAPKTIVANIYRHGDGYPNGECGVLHDLKMFFSEVRRQTAGGMGGTRFSDPAYLAAKFVVWQAGQNSCAGKPLDFISLGVVNEDAPDGAYVYTLDCGNLTKRGTPRISYRSVRA